MTLKRKIYIKSLLLIICFLSLINNFWANNNDYSNLNSHLLQIGATGTLNITATDRLVLFNNYVNYKAAIKAFEFNAQSKWIYGMKKSGLSNNDFQTTLDANYFHDKIRHINSWILANYNTSYALNIYNEYQMGFGFAWKILDTPKSKLVYLKVSDGFLYENSDFKNSEGNDDKYRTLRNTLRVQLNFNLFNNNIQLRTTTFYQPSMHLISDYNLNTTAILTIPIYKNIKLDTRFEYNFVARTQRENTFLSYGITYRTDFKSNKRNNEGKK